MARKFDYQFVVLGSGAAGSAAALLAKSLGSKTAIIEADRWGGTTLNRSEERRVGKECGS